MKKLQNNFTTPEQSKRLLELGVPADSADCYYQNALTEPKKIPSDRKYQEYTNSLTGMNRETWYFKPCWSAGRLMEIYGICMGVEGFFYCKGNFIDEAIRRIKGSVRDNLIDFSKLENEYERMERK